VLYLATPRLNAWIAGLLWPLTRILGLVAAAPVFGNSRRADADQAEPGRAAGADRRAHHSRRAAVDPMSWAGILILARKC
jgi:flagellar biosynthetic protein FliR